MASHINKTCNTFVSTIIHKVKCPENSAEESLMPTFILHWWLSSKHFREAVYEGVDQAKIHEAISVAKFVKVRRRTVADWSGWLFLRRNVYQLLTFLLSKVHGNPRLVASSQQKKKEKGCFLFGKSIEKTRKWIRGYVIVSSTEESVRTLARYVFKLPHELP